MPRGKSKTCPECGGPAKGRGYSHAAGCSRATRPASRANGRRGRRSVSTAAAGGRIEGWDLRRLKALDVERLVQLRDSIGGMIKRKAPFLQEKIRQLQSTLDSIRGR